MNRQESQLESLHDVEALCLELCAELREMVEMLATYRDTIGNAARLIARAARYPLIGGLDAAELARELAKMAYIEEEINRLLPPSVRGNGQPGGTRTPKCPGHQWQPSARDALARRRSRPKSSTPSPPARSTATARRAFGSSNGVIPTTKPRPCNPRKVCARMPPSHEAQFMVSVPIFL